VDSDKEEKYVLRDEKNTLLIDNIALNTATYTESNIEA
jgi:hypothetical protein